MIRLVGGEVRKLFTTKLWLWMALGAIALTAMFMSFTIAFDGTEGNPQPPLSTAEGQRNLFSVPPPPGCSCSSSASSRSPVSSGTRR